MTTTTLPGTTTGSPAVTSRTMWAHVVMLAVFLALAQGLAAQTRTVGLFVNDSRAFPGYTLFSPKHYPWTYLIDNAGRIVHTWTKSIYEPGQSVILMENGHLMRSCMTKGPLSTGGGEGGRIEEYDWEGNLVWELDWSTAQYMQHHDFRLLPNGNVLLLAVEKKTVEEALAAGFNPANFQPEITTKGYLVPDYVVEIQPTRPKGGKVVWEWHVWDHLVQDYSSSKANYGNPAAYPERVDPAGDGKKIPSFWNHMNAIYYNAAFDQIALSVRNNSEVWVIDHSTTTAEAASHSGGKRGKGGDLLYRWGNPIMYRAGTAADQKLYQQHDTRWVDLDCPGAGNMTAFNNGLGRNYSTIGEWTPPVDAEGNYAKTAGQPFGPKDFTWSYKATPPTSLYAEAISSAQRLPNGNTLICDGTHGTFLEVTTAGETVWKYVSPVAGSGPLAVSATIPADPARAGEYMNAVFRVQRYPLTYAGLVGRDLTPGPRVEIDPRPYAGFTISPSAPKAGEAVTFTDSSGNAPTGWSWSFGDNGTSTLQNPSHVFASAGTYTVTLTATNASGSDSTSKVVTVSSAGGTSVSRFLPIVLDVTGRARYVSELTLANRGTTEAAVTLTYTAASTLGGTGSGPVSLTLAAGRQLVVDDAIAYLRTKGLAIPTGNQGGTLRAAFENLSSSEAAYAGVR
ncbi:MAG: aryl-sulfate sulfotransferase, partial [Thermoanaerobaculia bacterium]|nr:aryl-sulfate sulfotransferase [Thermoanaerobaculia bacterium]